MQGVERQEEESEAERLRRRAVAVGHHFEDGHSTLGDVVDALKAAHVAAVRGEELVLATDIRAAAVALVEQAFGGRMADTAAAIARVMR